MIGWLRGRFRRVTVADVEQGQAEVRAATDRLGDVLDQSFLNVFGEVHVISDADLRAAIAAAPCEPTRAPDLVARARANRAAHYRALGEDPDANWGPYVNPHDEPGSAA